MHNKDGIANTTIVLNGTSVPLQGFRYNKQIIETINFLFTNIFPAYLGIGAFLNFLIAIYFIKINFKKLTKTTPYHFMIINLAMTDFSTCAGLSILIHYWVQSTWKLGEIGCFFMADFFKKVCMLSSCWYLVLISYARYRSIVKPLERRLSKRKIVCACVIIWVVSFGIFMKFFVNRKLIVYGGGIRCSLEHINMKINITYMLVGYCLDSFFPIGMMFYLYWKIKQKLDSDQRSNTFPDSSPIWKWNQTALRTIKALTVLYASAVIPGRVFHTIGLGLATHAQNSKNKYFYDYAIIFTNILSPFAFYSNNILNLFIYAKMIPDFRKFLLMIITFGLYGRRATFVENGKIEKFEFRARQSTKERDNHTKYVVNKLQ